MARPKGSVDDIFDELPEGADEWALLDMVGED